MILMEFLLAVGAQAPEFTADGVGRNDIQCRAVGDGQMGHIIVDANCVVIGRMLRLHIVVHGLDHVGGGILAGQTETAGIDRQVRTELFKDSRYLFVQGFAHSTGFLVPIQNGNGFDCGRQGCQERFCAERTEQMHFHISDLGTGCVQMIHRHLSSAGNRAQPNQNRLCIGCTVIVEQMIITAGDGVDLGHILLDNLGHCIVVAVHRFAGLEIGIAVQAAGTGLRILRILAVFAETAQLIVINALCQFIVIQAAYFLDLMAGAEPVKEMQERNVRLDCRQMCHRRHIHGLLHVAGTEHGKTGLAASHHIRVLSKDGDVVGSHIAAGHMNHARLELTSDPVHGGDHQHQALTGCIAGSQYACIQSPMHSAHGTGFALHLHKLDWLTEDVFLSRSSPLVGQFRHRAGGCDGVDGRHLGKCIRVIVGILIAVNGLPYVRHCSLILSNFYGIW